MLRAKSVRSIFYVRKAKHRFNGAINKNS